jgi:uncharacterized protein DUF4232
VVNTRAVLLGISALALVAGCGSSSSAGPATQPSGVAESPSPTPSQSSVAPASPTPTATVTVTHTASAAACSSSHLALSLGIGQGTAGTTYQVLVLTNTGSTSCTLFGYPGVSFVDASGAIIGKPSSRDPGVEHTITLPAGGAANALSRQPDAGNFPASACNMKTADRVRVYPPNQKQPLFVHDAIQLCSTSQGRTGIGPMLAGNGG